MTIKESIIETVETLTRKHQKEVLDFAQFLLNRRYSNGGKKRRIIGGTLEHLKPDVSAEDIDQARREMWRGYMSEDFEDV